MGAIVLGDRAQGTGDRWCSRDCRTAALGRSPRNRDTNHLCPVPCALSPRWSARLLLNLPPMPPFEKAPPEARQLLTVPIRELGLSLERSPVAPFVRALYAELDAAGLRRFRPRCYLSDEWGCPSEEPVIGIPFYLGDPRVAHLEDVVNDVESEQEILRYLRHEAGHAFNYAYELFRAAEWHELFGSFRRPYRDAFPFVRFSKDYVRHIAGWYAQKHPDEDFAETFAVWLDPESNWGAHDLGDRAPVHVEGETDVTVEEMAQTVEEFYRETTIDETRAIEELALDAD